MSAKGPHFCVVGSVQVAGLAPEENSDLQWNYGLELSRKKPKERLFLENSLNIYKNNNNSQMSSSLDLLQPGSVSTGLELSLDNPRAASSGDSSLLGLVGVDLDRELRRHDAEIDRYVKLQVGISRFVIFVSMNLFAFL